MGSDLRALALSGLRGLWGALGAVEVCQNQNTQSSFEVPSSGRRMQEESPLIVNRPQVDKIGVLSSVFE